MTLFGRALPAVLCAFAAALALGSAAAPSVSVTHAHVSIQHLLLAPSALGDLAASAAPNAETLRVSLAMLEVGLSEPVHVTRAELDTFAPPDEMEYTGVGLTSLTCGGPSGSFSVPSAPPSAPADAPFWSAPLLSWMMPLSSPSPWLRFPGTALPALWSLLGDLLGSDSVTSRLVFAIPLSVTPIHGPSADASEGAPLFVSNVMQSEFSMAVSVGNCSLTFLPPSAQPHPTPLPASAALPSGTDHAAALRRKRQGLDLPPGEYTTIPHRLSHAAHSHSHSHGHGYGIGEVDASGVSVLDRSVSRAASLAGLKHTLTPEPLPLTRTTSLLTPTPGSPLPSLSSVAAQATASERSVAAGAGPFFARLTCPRARAAAAAARSLLPSLSRVRGSAGGSVREALDADDEAVLLEEEVRVERTATAAAEAAANAAAGNVAASPASATAGAGTEEGAGVKLTRAQATAAAGAELRAAADAAEAAAASSPSPSAPSGGLRRGHPAVDRSWIGSDDEVAFLSVGAMAGGVNFGQLAEPLVKGSAKGMQESVGGAVLAYDAYQLNAMTGPALDMAMEDVIVKQLVSSTVQPIDAVFPFSIAAVMQAQLPGIIAVATAEAVRMRVTRPITKAATSRIQRALARILPESIEMPTVAAIVKGSGGDLLHTLVLALPTIITPALAHTVTHDPRVDYFCFYCTSKQLYCEYCNDHREKVGRQAYYAQYYNDYYARHYGRYYRDFFVAEEVERLVGAAAHQRRLQALADNRWDKPPMLVVEDIPGPYDPPPVRILGEAAQPPIPAGKYLKIPPVGEADKEVHPIGPPS